MRIDTLILSTGTGLLLAAWAAIFMAQPVPAAESCKPVLSVARAIEHFGFPTVHFPAGEGLQLLVDGVERRDKIELGNVTHGFIYNPDGTIYVVFEVDGCATPRIKLVTPNIYGSGKDWRSGRVYS